MTTATATYTNNGLTTDAAYRTALQAWETLFDDLGITRSSGVTGQPDFTTITTATTSPYETREWTPVGGTTTVYMRVAYNLNGSALRVQIAAGATKPAATSGSPASAVSTQAPLVDYTSSLASTTLYGSVTDETLSIMVKGNDSPSTTGGAHLVLETRSDGSWCQVYSGYANTASASNNSGIRVYSAPGVSVGSNMTAPLPLGYTGSDAPDVEAISLPYRTAAAEPWKNLRGFLIVPSGEIAAWSTVDWTVDGVSRTYMVLPGGFQSYGYVGAVIYE